MNILFLSDSFWPDDTGGITKAILVQVEGLAHLGHAVTVVSRRLQDEHPICETRPNYTLYRYPSPPRNSKFYHFYPLFSLIVLPRLVKRLHQQTPFDVAFIHNPFQAAGVNFKQLNLPYIYSYHASVANEIRLDAGHDKYGRWSIVASAIIRWAAWIEQRVLTRADQVLVESDFMAQDLTRLISIPLTKISHIPLAVDTDKYFFTANPAVARQKLNLPLQRPILLTVRRLVARVGLENLISAMSLVVAKTPEVLLLIVGRGYLHHNLLDQIIGLHLQHNISLVGFVPEELLPSYYQAADLFVLPTFEYEGFGLATLEALSCGTPVLATPVGASPEILSPLGDEYLLKDKTPAAIAEGLNYWLIRGMDTQLRRKCREFCAYHFSQDRICVELVNLLAEVSLKKS